MDFLEGFLLGPIWSDTEYETRRHTGFYWFVGWLVLGGYVWVKLKPATLSTLLSLPQSVPVAFFLVLLLGTPFACRYYYKFNIMFKILVILVESIKLGAAFLAFFQSVLPLYTISLDTLPEDFLEYINQTIAGWTGSFETLGQGLGMLVGVVTGGLQVVFTLIGIILAATIVPALFLLAIQLLQRGVDLLVHRFIYQDIDL